LAGQNALQYIPAPEELIYLGLTPIKTMRMAKPKMAITKVAIIFSYFVANID
jgi:hypothetical protein